MTHTPDISAFEKLFLALSDPTRLRLLTLMTNGPVAVGYLAAQLGESQPKTSRHLAYLRNAGLVSTSREGKWVYYEIAQQHDVGIEQVLMATLRNIEGSARDSPVRTVSFQVDNDARHNDTFAEAYIKDWSPNELEIHLL